MPQISCLLSLYFGHSCIIFLFSFLFIALHDFILLFLSQEENAADAAADAETENAEPNVAMQATGGNATGENAGSTTPKSPSGGSSGDSSGSGVYIYPEYFVMICVYICAFFI